MEGQRRRDEILKILATREEPVSGSALSKQLGVSRQVIVQDIALLRAVNQNILSTTKGYVLYKKDSHKVTRCFTVKHTTEEIEEELCTIVDNGGTVVNVIVIHEIYGQIETKLDIRTRQDVYEFVRQVKEKQTVPLKELTAGIHLHLVEADSEERLDQIEAELIKRKFLIQE